MGITIVSLAETDSADRVQLCKSAERVFWETAVGAEFPSSEERRLFRYKYFDYYRDNAPELFLVARLGEHVHGYICGVADTRKHPTLYEVAEHVPVFADLYDRYPAHLHINLDGASRGKGLGSRLVQAFEEHLVRGYAAPGLHLVTSEGSRNVNFYRKNGFVFEVARGFSGSAPSSSVHPDINEPRMLLMAKGLLPELLLPRAAPAQG